MAPPWLVSTCSHGGVGGHGCFPCDSLCPTLSHIHRVCLEEARLPPSAESTLAELASVLEMLSPLKEPMVVMGDLNARTAALHPNVEGQLPIQSTDTTVNAWGCALLALLE